MSSNPPGRASQGRPVSQDQYARERGLPGQAPMNDPAGVSYPPGSAPLGNPGISDSFFYPEADKSSFMNDGQQSVMVNPYTNQAPAQAVKKMTTTTTTTTQQTTQQAEQKGFNNPYTSTSVPPIVEQGRSTVPPPVVDPLPLAGRSTAPSQFRLVSSKMQYDNTISPDADDLLRKSGVTGPSKMIATETVIKKETVNAQFQGKSLQERFDFLSTKTRDQEWKIHELEDKIASMMLERDKMINDYEAYIDKLTIEKEELKGLEGLVKRLEAEKEFLEREIEKVRSIKLMLENQLSAYNEHAEIQRFRSENEKLKEDMKRLKHLIFVETGQIGDPNRVDVRGAITKFKSEVTVVQQENQRIVSERNDLLRKIAVLEDELKFNQGDAFTEIKTLRNTVESYKKQIGNLQEAHADTKRTDAGTISKLNANLKLIQQENEALRKNIDSMKSNMRHADESVQTQEINILRERLREVTVNTPHIGEVEKIRGELMLMTDAKQRLEERNVFLQQQMEAMAANPREGNNQVLVNQIRELNQRIDAEQRRNFEVENQLRLARLQIDELRRNQVTNITQTNYSGSAVATNNRGNMENRGPGGNYLGTGGVNSNNQTKVETKTVTHEYVHVNNGGVGQLTRVAENEDEDGEPSSSQTGNRVVRKKQVHFAPGNSTYQYQYGSEGPEAGDPLTNSEVTNRKVTTTFINNTEKIDGSSLSFGQNSDAATQNYPGGNTQGGRIPIGTSNRVENVTTINEVHYEYYIDEAGNRQQRPIRPNHTDNTRRQEVTHSYHQQSGGIPYQGGSFGDLDDPLRGGASNHQSHHTNVSKTFITNETSGHLATNLGTQSHQTGNYPQGSHQNEVTVIDQRVVHIKEGDQQGIAIPIIHHGQTSSATNIMRDTQVIHHHTGLSQGQGFQGNFQQGQQGSQNFISTNEQNFTTIQHHTDIQGNRTSDVSHQQNSQNGVNSQQQTWTTNQVHNHSATVVNRDVNVSDASNQNKLNTTSATGLSTNQTAVQQSQAYASQVKGSRHSPSRLPDQLPAFPTLVLEPSFVRHTVDLAEGKETRNTVGSVDEHQQERTTKLEGVLAKKQREIDDLLMRVFLLAAENDRLRNEDQLLQNIRVIRNSPLVQRSMEINKAAREKDPVHHDSNTYHTLSKAIPQVNSIGQESTHQRAAEYQRTHVSTHEVKTTEAGSASSPVYHAWHAEQAYENKDNADIHLYQRYQRNNRDVESIIQEVYEKHGLTKELSSSKPNPHKTTITTRIEQTHALAQSTIPAHELRKTELDDYFKKLNQKLMEKDSNQVILDRVASPERDLRHDSQLGATVLDAEHA